MQRPLAPAAILGVSFVVGMMILGMSAVQYKAADRFISVTGSAQKTIISDRAVWHVTLSRTAGLDDAAGGSKLMNQDLQKLLSYVKKSGMTGSGIIVKPVSVETLMNYNVNQPAGYTFRQEVVISSSDVQGLTTIAQGAASLFAEGALVSTASLEYYYSKLPELRIAMLAAATNDARLRAEKIAESAGASLGGLQDASMGVIQLTAANSVDVSDYGTYDTSSIEKQLTAIVRASFAIKK